MTCQESLVNGDTFESRILHSRDKSLPEKHPSIIYHKPLCNIIPRIEIAYP